MRYSILPFIRRTALARALRPLILSAPLAFAGNASAGELLHYYPADAVLGVDGVEDVIGGAHGILDGAFVTQDPTYVARGAGALALDGFDDFVDLPPITLGEKFTLMAWVRIPPEASNIQTIVASGPSLGANSPGFRLFINEFQTDNARIVFETGNGAQSARAWTPPNTFVNGCHQHVAVSVDTDTSDGTPDPTARIYYNGFDLTEPGTTTILGDFDMGSSTASLDVGQMTNAVWNLAGWIDEIMIFDGVLSRQEIRDAAEIVQPVSPPAMAPLAFPGLDFSPYADGQEPPECVPAEQIWKRLNVVSSHTDSIRTYSTRSGLGIIPRMAKELNLGVAMGATINEDVENNEIQIANLLESAKAEMVDIAVIGNEVLYSDQITLPLVGGATTETEALISYLGQVRTALDAVGRSDVLVTTAEPFDTLFMADGGGGWQPRSPELIAALDVVQVNIYPFHDSVHIDDALTSLQSRYADAVAAVDTVAAGKPVYISETGWPTAGAPKGAAVPSLLNAKRYLHDTISWANSAGVVLFYFEAFDENWKGPEVIEKHWGVWDANGRFKFVAVPALSDGALIGLGAVLMVLGLSRLRRGGGSSESVERPGARRSSVLCPRVEER